MGADERDGCRLLPAQVPAQPHRPRSVMQADPDTDRQEAQQGPDRQTHYFQFDFARMPGIGDRVSPNY